MGLLHGVDVAAEMSLPQCVPVAGVGEAFGCVLSQGFQQPVPGCLGAAIGDDQ